MENVILFSTPQAIAMMEETAKVVKYHPVTMKIAAIHSKLRPIYPQKICPKLDIKTGNSLGSEKVMKNQTKGMFPEGMRIYRLKTTFP